MVKLSISKDDRQDYIAPDLQRYLVLMFLTMGLCCLCAAAGGFSYLYYEIVRVNITWLLPACLLTLGAITFDANKSLRFKRVVLLCLFAYLSGVVLCPFFGAMALLTLLEPAAILVGATIFASSMLLSFALVSIISETRNILYIQGIVATALFWSAIVVFTHANYREYDKNVYIQLATLLTVMTGYLAINTEYALTSVIQKGEIDLIGHAAMPYTKILSGSLDAAASLIQKMFRREKQHIRQYVTEMYPFKDSDGETEALSEDETDGYLETRGNGNKRGTQIHCTTSSKPSKDIPLNGDNMEYESEDGSPNIPLFSEVSNMRVD
jgi:hypothetical protein